MVGVFRVMGGLEGTGRVAMAVVAVFVVGADARVKVHIAALEVRRALLIFSPYTAFC